MISSLKAKSLFSALISASVSSIPSTLGFISTCDDTMFLSLMKEFKVSALMWIGVSSSEVLSDERGFYDSVAYDLSFSMSSLIKDDICLFIEC